MEPRHIIIKALQPSVGLGLVKDISPFEAVRSCFFPAPNSQNPLYPSQLRHSTDPSASTPLQCALHQPLWGSRAFHALHKPCPLHS
ncbi:jg15654 [Pararge aegeria aegeria]|uniref:Jg15654 protein n=1 Tax=Pararge aegeria aegeria TaxID=348720 RepID=A0A8S4RST6_9NEOP|nr:jg15654 [Pararge aegeria aegeria]